ncbi:serum response factor-binding protein 1-like [Haliotis rubra]|uniref:serum response factor-binding protein 1-like n=1 Tax=Haliotis rubra TaxID=36100 RepID=UPI001EE5A285|nr:serum response factor-binding protein 1-like [Haliotis rubra]XP_046559987.1 serum response factor-binding protein 1-like [Haliotis rubra]
MSTDKLRSLDVAKTASIDLMALNNNIVTMRKRVKQAKVRVIRRLVRSIDSLKKKKGTPVMLEKNKRKAERLVEEIHAIKHLKADKISKFAIGNTISFVELCKQDNSSIQSRALTRVSENEVIQKEVTRFRDSHPDWKSLSAFLLMKQSGRRYKKKKNRSTAEKVDTNIKAREAMMEAYLDNRLEKKKVDIEKVKKSGQVGKGKQKKNLVKNEAESDGSSGNMTSSDGDSEDEINSEGSDSEELDREEADRTKVTQGGSVKKERFSGVEKEPMKTWDDSDSGDSDETEQRTTQGQSPKKSSLQDASFDRENQRKEGSEKDGNKKKGGLKLEILQQMFSSKDGDSESESDSGQSSGGDEVKEVIRKSSKNAKLKSKIIKEMLPADSSGDDSDLEEDMTEEELNESDILTDLNQRKNENKQKKTKSSKHAKQKGKNKIMVVKKINLEDLENDEDLKEKKFSEDVPGILLSPEVKKTRDAFFAGSDDESDGEDEEQDEASSQDNSSEDEGEGPSAFETTFIGTLAHKKQLKRGVGQTGVKVVDVGLGSGDIVSKDVNFGEDMVIFEEEEVIFEVDVAIFKVDVVIFEVESVITEEVVITEEDIVIKTDQTFRETNSKNSRVAVGDQGQVSEVKDLTKKKTDTTLIIRALEAGEVTHTLALT